MDQSRRLGVFELRIEGHSGARADILEPEMVDHKLERQFVRFVRLEAEARVRTVDGVDHNADMQTVR